jgi:tetratricopeptide (TPR) repeat protein/DNA-binding XRE family transcriptional regulator
MGWSQETLAAEAALRRKTIHNIEKHGRAGSRTIAKLARAFDVPVETMTELDESAAHAVFLAARVSRLGATGRDVFFRELRGRIGHFDEADVLSTSSRTGAGASSVNELSDAVSDEQFASEPIPDFFRFPRSEWRRRFEEEPRYRTITFARQLLTEADRVTFEDPRVAIDYYRFALSVIDDIGATLPSHHELRVTAWKNLAWALRCVGDYKEAEAALDTAEEAAAWCSDRDRQLARLKLSRAILLGAMQRLDEAVALAREAGVLLSRLNDAAGYEMALEEEAVLLLNKNDGSGALAILERLPIDDTDDETKARRLTNLAIAFGETGALAEAQIYLERALAHHQMLGWQHLLVRDRWVLGGIQAKRGDIDGALATLDRAAEEFRAMEDADSAVRVDLERCEIEIEHGRADSSTFDRLRAASAYAIEKRLPQSACRALLFLQRLGRAANVRHIRYVKDFIRNLDQHPHREFVPPQRAA